MKLNYQRLKSYDHLVSAPTGKKHPIQDIEIINVPEFIKTITLESYKQVQKLSDHLFDKNHLQFYSNIWHFCRENFKYKEDRIDCDEYREPARAWKDRFTGIDCDCFTIFINCLLLCQKIDCQSIMVGCDGRDYHHIYAAVNCTNPTGDKSSQGIVLDPVMKVFNQHPPGITIFKITNMRIERLAGNNKTQYIKGLGGLVAPMSNPTSNYIGLMQNLINSKVDDGMSNNEIAVALAPHRNELSCLGFLISLNGNPVEQKIYSSLWKYMDHIDSKGEVIFNHLNSVAEILFGHNAISGLGDLGELGSLKSICKKLTTKAKDLAKKTTTALEHVAKEVGKVAKDTAHGVAKLAKKEWQTAKEVAKKAIHLMMMLNPLTLAARNAFLVLLIFNCFNFAKKLSVGTGTLADAKKRGYSDDEYKKISAKVEDMKRLWIKLGGDQNKLVEHINKGKNKKALFAIVNKNVKGLGYGLGEEPAASLALGASIAAGAAAILKPILSLFKGDDKHGGTKEDTIPPTSFPHTNSDGSKTYQDGHILYANGEEWYPGPPPYIKKADGSKVTDPDVISKEKIDDSAASAFAQEHDDPTGDTGGKSNTIWYLSAAAAAGAILLFKFVF